MSIVPQLHHRIIGPENGESSAIPLVLLHGLMGFSANWGKIWPQFQAGRAVLVFDQRGHGRSFKPAKGYTPTDYSHDLAELLTQLGWKQVHVVGHSMGGRVALRFCASYPSVARTLTLEDSGMEANPARIDWIKNLLGSIPTPFRDREEAKRFFSASFANDPMTGSFLHANLETKESGELDWKFFAPGMIETIETGRATDSMEEFARLSLPALVVRGELSREFPRAEAERMLAAKAGAEFVEISGAGHFVHAEKPAEFSRALAAFIEKHDS